MNVVCVCGEESERSRRRLQNEVWMYDELVLHFTVYKGLFYLAGQISWNGSQSYLSLSL